METAQNIPIDPEQRNLDMQAYHEALFRFNYTLVNQLILEAMAKGRDPKSFVTCIMNINESICPDVIREQHQARNEEFAFFVLDIPSFAPALAQHVDPKTKSVPYKQSAKDLVSPVPADRTRVAIFHGKRCTIAQTVVPVDILAPQT